jgi:hypothetical protein
MYWSEKTVKDRQSLKAIGRKLRDFRQKLEDVLQDETGMGVLSQQQFGEVFGGYKKDAIQKYEVGENEIPARLLYLILLKGQSIDALLGDGHLTVTREAIVEMFPPARDLNGPPPPEEVIKVEDRSERDGQTAGKDDKTGKVPPKKARVGALSKGRTKKH